MGIGVIEFVLVHIAICFVFAVFCCVWYWREKRASRARRRRSERAADRFYASLAAEAVNPTTAARVASERAIIDRPVIPFLAILPDSTLILAVLDKDVYSATAPLTPPSTRNRSLSSDISGPTSQSIQPSEPPSSSHIVYVPPPQPQYIPPEGMARYPMPPQTPPRSVPPTHSSNPASGQLRRFGILRLPSYRRAEFEGIPTSLIWSIVPVDLKYCPWAHARCASHHISRSGSSVRLATPTRSFRAFYGAMNLLRGDSSSASRLAAPHPSRDDSVHLAPPRRPSSQTSWTSMLGWRAPFLHGLNSEMGMSMYAETPGLQAGTSAGIDAATQDGSGHVNPSGASRSSWLGRYDASGTDVLQASLSTPTMSLGRAIQLHDLSHHDITVQTRISEVDTFDGTQ